MQAVIQLPVLLPATTTQQQQLQQLCLMRQLEMTPCQACPWLQMRALISPCPCREAPCTHCQPNGPQSQCDCLLTWHVRRRFPPAVHRYVWVLLLFVPPSLPSLPFSRSLNVRACTGRVYHATDPLQRCRGLSAICKLCCSGPARMPGTGSQPTTRRHPAQQQQQRDTL
jgi:hypothetical protein